MVLTKQSKQRTREREKRLSEQINTPLSDRADILAELWIQYKGSDGFEDFMSYNDLGLPLAYSVSHGIIEINDMVESFINETFDVLLDAMSLEDTGYTNLKELFDDSGTEIV